MELAKLLHGGALSLLSCESNTCDEYNELIKDGYMEFIPAVRPEVPSGHIEVDTFSVIDGKLVQAWRIEVDKEPLHKRIDELKASLAEGDYQVVKCYEASLIGRQAPYDMVALHTERQRMRDEINSLQRQINA
jgi:hypothetical protein